MKIRVDRDRPDDLRTAFIVGPPRSGTTILEEILGSHQQIGHIYEPYYLWYFHVKDFSTDQIPTEDFGAAEARWIQSQFARFGRASKAKVIVEKSPEHSLNLPIIRRAFPNAKIIYIVRDGRDVVLSTKKEWQKRKTLVEERRFVEQLAVAKTMLSRQPLWRFRLIALWFELKTRIRRRPAELLKMSSYLNKSKWKGYPGWGIRFKGWEEVISSQSPICFMAYQWLRATEKIQEDLPAIPESDKMIVRYEDLVSEDYQRVVAGILDFLGLVATNEFWESMPKIKVGNTRKWPRELTRQEIQEIGSILADKLIELGYENTRQWFAG